MQPSSLTDTQKEFEKHAAGFAPAKQELLRFICFSKENEPYIFSYPGNSIQAQAFLYNMRTCLSRYRSELARLKLPIKKFKIKTISMDQTELDGRPVTHVTIMMKRNDNDKLADDVTMIFKHVGLNMSDTQG